MYDVSVIYKFLVNPTALLIFVSAFQSLVFDYVPGLAGKFDALDKSQKRIIMLALNILFAGAAFAGQCYGIFETNLTCDLQSGLDLGSAVFMAVTVTYSVHEQTKPSGELKEKIVG